MSDDVPGTVLAGSYRLIEIIGRGGIGTVYKALDLTFNRFVAIKVLHPQPLTSNPYTLAREVRAAQALQHPNILRVLNVVETDGSVFLVMELLEGRSLADMLRDGKPLDPDRAMAITSEVGAALAFAHERRLVHRDVKPSNILVSNLGRVVLSDFGLLLDSGDISITAAGWVLGTPAYMSPEQAMGARLDARSDIYSLAVVVYEALSGRSWVPSGSSVTEILRLVVEVPLPSIRTINPRVPATVDQVLQKALAKSAADRYQSVVEFVDALGKAGAQPFGDTPHVGTDYPDDETPARILRPRMGASAPQPAAPIPTSSALPNRVNISTRILVVAAATAVVLGAPFLVWSARSATSRVGFLLGMLIVLAGAAAYWLLGSPFPLADDPEPYRSRQVRRSGDTSAHMGRFDDPTTAAPPYQPVHPYRGGDSPGRVAEFETIWGEIVRAVHAKNKDLFATLAESLTRNLLREAIGYRIDQPIPYLKGTIGWMVEAPLLWMRYSRFPILFVAHDRGNADVLATIVQQLEIARATEFFALLIVVPPAGENSGQEATELRQLVADSVYRHDFVVLDREHVASVIAQNSSRAMIEIILEQGAELSTLSPYVVTGPVPGSMFFGRESEIKTISQTILRENHAIVGGRRIGKSSVLLRLKRLLGDNPRYMPIYLDCEARFDYEDFFVGLSEYVDGPVGDDPLHLQQALDALRSENASPNRLPVFLFDEIDELLAFDADRKPPAQLFKAFRAASHEDRCRFVFSGSRTLHRHLRDPASPFFNFCEATELGPLQKKSIAEIVRKPMQQLGVELIDEEGVVLRLIELTSCHPNIAQWTCDRLLKSSIGRRITLESLEELAATPEFFDYYVATAWSDATPVERLISLLIEQPVFDQDSVAQKLAECGLPLNGRLVQESLEILRLYSLLERDGARYRFALSHFPRIIRESGVAAAQLDNLTAEVLSQCS